jgi:hypothetical protein
MIEEPEDICGALDCRGSVDPHCHIGTAQRTLFAGDHGPDGLNNWQSKNGRLEDTPDRLLLGNARS